MKLKPSEFDKALHLLTYPDVKFIPRDVLDKAFNIAKTQGITIQRAAELIKEQIDKTHMRIHGLLGETSIKSIIDRLTDTGLENRT